MPLPKSLESRACAFGANVKELSCVSVNQPTVEAGISDEVKTLLQDINVQSSMGTPEKVMIEQLDWFAAEVMAPMRQAEAAD